MVIHDWYVDPGASSNGDGSKTNPFKTLVLLDSAIKVVNNDIHRVHLKTGTTLRERIPLHLTQQQLGLYMDVYGGSTEATLDITTPASFTLNADKDWYTAKLGTKDWGDKEGWLTIGAVFEDGIVMKMRMYNSNHNELRAAMQEGEYSYDMNTGMVYMVPTDKDRHEYTASTASQILAIGAPGPFWNQDKVENKYMWNRTFEGLIFKGAKRCSVEVMGSGKVSIRQCGFYGIGGQAFDQNNAYLGNGIEIGGSASQVEVKNCWFDQIFDTAASPQAYTPGDHISDFVFEDNVISNNGLAALEISTQVGGNADTSTRNVVVRFNHIKGNKDSFAPDIYHGRYIGISVIYNAPGSKLENIVIQKNLIEDQVYNGMTVTGGDGLLVSDNEIKRCNLGIFHGIGRDQSNSMDFRQNRILDCITGIRTNSGIDRGTATFRDNVIQGGEKAFSDGSPVNYNVVLNNNVLNSKRAIEATRTQDITGSGNTSTGSVDSKYDYLMK